MACRYHKLPSQILNEDIRDFNLDLVIFYKAIMKEQKELALIKKHKGKVVRKGNVLRSGGFSIKKNLKGARK